MNTTSRLCRALAGLAFVCSPVIPPVDGVPASYGNEPDIYELAKKAGAAQKDGQYRIARDLYSQILVLRPDIAEVRANLGFMDHLLGSYPEAVANLKEALARDPSLANAATVLGIDLIKLHKPDEARFYLERNCNLVHLVTEACLALGQASVITHHFDSAIRSYKKVLADHPRNSKAMYGLGFTYLVVYQNSVDKIAQLRGSEYLRRLTDSNTPNPGLSESRKSGDIEALLNATREGPGVETWYRLAFRARELTIRSLSDAYQEDPDSPKALLLEAQAAGSQLHDNDARREYRTLLSENPDDQNANIGLASIYIRLFQDREAMPLLDKVLRSHPTDPEANYLKGQLLVFEDQDEEALPLIKIALRTEDSYLRRRAWILLAKIYRSEGRWADAIDALEMVRQDDSTGSIAYQLYQLYKKVGKSEAAISALSSAKSSRIRDKQQRDQIKKTLTDAMQNSAH